MYHDLYLLLPQLLIMEMNDQGAKRQKRSAYYVPELTHMVALCEDRIPFILLADEVRF